MSVYEERREELEKHEFMMGKPRGQLAVTFDVLTDALVPLGQHGVYCQDACTPGKPAMDIPLENKLIAGDTLFRDHRTTDLPGGDGRKSCAPSMTN